MNDLSQIRHCSCYYSFVFFIIYLLSVHLIADHSNTNDQQVTYNNDQSIQANKVLKVELGPRPLYLINNMSAGSLKQRLLSCQNRLMKPTQFSIGHRGAAMQFPEHTRESYIAAANMGAGMLECDVTFTKDRQLVCRHSQCDLHNTTNILAIPRLAKKCSIPFQPADPANSKPAVVKCCTSDITLAEFKQLQGKMDAHNPMAKNVQEYMQGTADWRTNLYISRGTLMTHKESIDLFKKLGVKMTPELKKPLVDMPFQGNYTQADYAQQLINDYLEANIKATDIYPQSFNLPDILFWQHNTPEYARRAVYLDDRVYTDENFSPSLDNMRMLKSQGVNIIAPPMWALLSLNENNKIIPSKYAKLARLAGLDIITWTFERSDLRQGAFDSQGQARWYYQSIAPAILTDGDQYYALDVLAQQVKILGIFSDWPATVSYYANCMQLNHKLYHKANFN